MPTEPINPASPPATPEWTAPLLLDPHHVPDKAERVNHMFTAIAPSYDLNNRLHSMGMDQHWRRVAVKMAAVKPTDTIVDVACGTGDLTLKFAAAKHKLTQGSKSPQPLDPTVLMGGVIGIDFTYAMLPIAQGKAARKYAIRFMQGDALHLPLEAASADIISIAFGIRNVSDWGAAIDEFYRVLKPGGRVVILEFSLPRNALLRGFYNFYFRKIMPWTATLISGDKTGAYKYLPESVNTFISREAMAARMEQAGFKNIQVRPLTFGICVCYIGTKT